MVEHTIHGCKKKKKKMSLTKPKKMRCKKKMDSNWASRKKNEGVVRKNWLLEV